MYSDPISLESWDKRFYGIYRGIVVDSNDPEDKRRVRLRIPQILGNAVTNWAWPVGGAISQAQTPYGTFVDTTNQTQTGGVANTATPIKFNTTEDANNVYIDTTNTTKIYVTESGDYFLQFSAVFSTPTSSAKEVDVWAAKNGVYIPRSNTRMVLTGNPNESVMVAGAIVDLDPGDYIQLYFSSSAASMTLKSFSGLTSPTRPDIPGIILTVNLIGKYKPKPDTGVWVQFEGGDPNFPLWIGSF